DCLCVYVFNLQPSRRLAKMKVVGSRSTTYHESRSGADCHQRLTGPGSFHLVCRGSFVPVPPTVLRPSLINVLRVVLESAPLVGHTVGSPCRGLSLKRLVMVRDYPFAGLFFVCKSITVSAILVSSPLHWVQGTSPRGLWWRCDNRWRRPFAGAFCCAVF